MKKSILALMGCLLASSGLAQAQAIATVGIAYSTTRGVRNSVGGSSNARSLLNLKYDLMRGAEARSVGNINWRRSAHFDASYDQQNQTSQTQLERLTRGNQLGGFRNHAIANNGDITQLYCDWTNLVNLGIAGRPGWASVCRRAVLTVNSGTRPIVWISAHEHAHNLNAAHADGFCLTSISQRTIMQVDSAGCARVICGYFSALSRRKDGIRLGDSTHQNRERIRAQAPINAAMR